MKKKKLVLFDIDGTLIRPLRPVEAVRRFSHAIRLTFGKEIPELTSEVWKTRGFNGMVDRGIMGHLTRDIGISQKDFLNALPTITAMCAEYLDTVASDGNPLYERISDAEALVGHVVAHEDVEYGALTGNLGKIAEWKLKHVGFPHPFAFGIYGHEADDRDSLARLAPKKAELHFGHAFAQKDIIVIGDTVHDIRCARVIGASAIAVTTGWNVDKATLVAEKPDLLVDSLMDPRVLTLLGIKE